jgi:monovalent cation/hydrogen antiporter
MQTDVLLIVVLSTVTVSPWLARVLHLPVPTVQFLLGCLLASVPAAGKLVVSPDLILLVVLPMILLWESYQTSLTWARRYWRPILLNGLFLVVVTAGGVAVIAHAFGFTWPAAWALGAVLAPTDASAVTAFGRTLPNRWMTVLRAESLINDGTALVILAVAVQSAEHRHFGLGSISARAAQSYGVGILVGLAATVVTVVLVRRITDPLVHVSFALLLPFLAAVPAEALHGSGVVAVVTCGIAGSRPSRRMTPARIRLPNHAFWEVTTFVLNGALFVLTGLQLRALVTHIDAGRAGTLLVQGFVIALLVIAIRFAWINAMTLVLRTFDRRPYQRTLRAPIRARVVSCWAGLRGGISLAAAFTIPAMAADAPFPKRQELLILTFIVVATTLLVQGSTLGGVIRWASPAFPATPSTDAVTNARRVVSERVRRAFDDEWFLSDADPEIRQLVQREIEERVARRTQDDTFELQVSRLRLDVLQRKRQELVSMVEEGELEDTVMWEVQYLLDHEEARLEAMIDALEPEKGQPAQPKLVGP